MFYQVGKRIIDVLGSIVGIVVFAPVMVATAVWIKLVSPEGPIFADIPDRMGKEKEFRLYKFRSMIPHAQKWLDDHPDWKKKYVENNFKLDPDPRWIRGARFIRKTSIDEMPQFLNVLKGEMSIVGPRAYYGFELKEQGDRYPDTVKYIDLVKTVKPGITGPWQVGGRSDIGFRDRIQMDAEYAKKHSLLYDLLIILKTPLAVVSQRGAS